MSDIVLATLNAKYIHAAFGLRYLLANLGELKSRAVLREFDINQRVMDIAEAILAEEPRILGLGVYIWNVVPTTELVAILKRARPDLIIVLGGPEVSYECDQQEIVRLADYVITGEAISRLRRFAANSSLASGRRSRSSRRRCPCESTRASVRSVRRERRRPSRHLRRGFARLPVHLRVLPVVAGYAGPRLSWSRFSPPCRGCWTAGCGSSSSSIAPSI